MTDLEARLALKKRLPRTWPAFFERHGNFTATQIAAISPVLDGDNVLLSAPTATGKTEAVIAPMVERHCPPSSDGLHLLYITPTRALVNDLYQRLASPFEHLHLRVATKTRDLNTFQPKRPAHLLISTPESVDSLLTSQARVFTLLKGVILDELHLFDGTPRGDHLRVLANRIRQLRTYAAQHGDADDADLQFAALSATLADPAAAAARYFADARVIEVAGARPIAADMLPLAADEDLRAYLAASRARGWRKTVVFCNTRSEAEYYASAVQPESPFGSAIYVHYSNIDAGQRREIEKRFARDEVALCFATSTLELGIDIGSIDIVILIGTPGDVHSFIQRIGRGNRRAQMIQVACFYRSPLEELLFRVFLAQAGQGDLAREHAPPFRPSVAVQQIFSIIKQNPAQSIRLRMLSVLFEGILPSQDVLMMIGYLEGEGYLVNARPGEWRAGPRLNKLVEEQSLADMSLSLYSNIRTEPRQVEVRDQETGQRIARVSAVSRQYDVMTLQGRSRQVKWSDGETVWVSSDAGKMKGPRLPYLSTRQYLSYETVQRLPIHLGLEPGTAPLIEAPEGNWWWFHWLGDLYGVMALDLLRYDTHAEATSQPGLAVLLPERITSVPEWSENQVQQYLTDHYRRFESMLDLGAYYQHVPAYLGQRVVLRLINPDRFHWALARLRLFSPPEDLAIQLRTLID